MTWKVSMNSLELMDDQSSRSAETDGILRVIKSGVYLRGDEVSAFEKEFSEWMGYTTKADGLIINPYCVAVASGFDALQLILRSYNIGSGDHVLVPSFAPLPVWMAVSIVGATPIPVECHLATYNIDREKLKLRLQTISPKAIIAVHLFGRPCDIGGIKKDLIDAGFPECVVIEDCSQAHGATIGEAKVGSFGDIAAFSFYPTKNLGACGDAGMVVMWDWDKWPAMRDLAFYGDGDNIGINSRMDELQAAILRAKLPNLVEQNRIRRENAGVYLRKLSGLADIALPVDHPGCVWHQFVIKAKDRKMLRKYLNSCGIETQIHYPKVPADMPVYRDAYKTPIASWLSEHVLSLPIGPHLSVDDIEDVCYEIRNYLTGGIQ
jgi:dTDP-4-amino-4,6-dideoxygalactose transaminase